MTERKLTYHNHSLYEGLKTVPCKWCENVGCHGSVPFLGLEDSLNHPTHCQHPLDFYWNGYFDQAPNKCYFCDEKPVSKIFRYCSLCNITVCLYCLVYPPPNTIYFQKCHKYKLTLFAREVVFTCNACGVEGNRKPYVCLRCSLIFHKGCIYLPRVININRHHHRISRTSHLSLENTECGVCRQSIDCAYGAFTCARFPTYAVHSLCATSDDVWDGKELEDEPEEEEIEAPYKVINETDIIHFSHKEHILRLCEDNTNMRCDGCVLPINNDPSYKCVECNLSLHKTCANLPRKKRHFLHNHKLTLLVDNKGEDYVFKCSACNQQSSGFRYGCGETKNCHRTFFDIRCTSLGEPFHHELHPHPLYRTSTDTAKCQGCNKDSDYVLSCIVCDYVLGVECATLPRNVKHRCDDHFLSLCHGVGNASGDLWCDICETRTDPSVWYYTCDACGVTLHVKCVLGDLYHMKEGIYEDYKFELLPNNGASRPLCIFCECNCRFPFLMKHTREESVKYFCSIDCWKRYIVCLLEDRPTRIKNQRPNENNG